MKIFFTFICLTFSVLLYSQESGAEWCSKKKSASKSILIPNMKLKMAPVAHSFDVLEYKFNLDLYNCFISPFPRNFNCDLIIKLKATTTISSIQLNASNNSLTINQVSLAGISYTHSSDFLTINLDKTYSKGDIVEVGIKYSHNNVIDYSIYVKNGMFFTDCEPEGARNWFPCWDKPSDKALLDLTAKVPSNVTLGSNGSLISTTADNNAKYVHWNSKDSIATYLISIVAKVDYNLAIVDWPRISNPSVIVPIYFYYNTGEDPTAMKNIIGEMTTFFSTKFGEHPFEKNGFATLNSDFQWGGMENQTLTSLCPNCWRESLVAHEFAHQWFGDMITCATWADIWINEGFATYLEMLWQEHKYGKTAYFNDLNNAANYYLTNNPGWAISDPSWTTSTPNVNMLFNYAITYEKGACVLHMLRYVLGDDMFFNVMKEYTSDLRFKYSNASIHDFNDKVNEVTGQNYNWFFDQWIFKPNHPLYSASFYISKNEQGYLLTLILKQNQTNPTCFKMPIEIKVTFDDGSETILKAMNDQNNQTFTFQLNKLPKNAVFDPNNGIVLKNLVSVVNKIDESDEQTCNLLENYPNPFSKQTIIRYRILNQSKVKLWISDINGRIINEMVNEVKVPGVYEETFLTNGLPAGLYNYTLNCDNITVTKKMMIIK